ncbi:beta-glucan synthesis-associated [Cantharellus anzutake]|uniref:beta-glucan synthesis-associated n=1 Tax=Cantharellus anzutake TaxID=1750568 RepID=UPI0019064DFD|nr:beta-glucan synthesis-associated [Cantharellus anzutake]KAF8331869.1 beta-glucan synthesis-associated [Cantharellus anzutake]
MPHKKTPSYPFSSGPNAVNAINRSSWTPLPPTTQPPETDVYPHYDHTEGNEHATLLEAVHDHDNGHEEAAMFMPEEASPLNRWNPNEPEPDDFLHVPDPRRDHKNDRGGTILTLRGLANLGFLFFLALALLTMFAGYPLASYFISLSHKPGKLGGYNIGGINASGQVPEIGGHFALIDPDTPSDAQRIKAFTDGSMYDLVFSDEFNQDGRTFYPGDDPYWEAVDLNYWQTGDLEWYDPSAITTKDGSLVITLNATQSHGKDFIGGHMSSWNKFCFQEGYIEVNVSLPGDPKVSGFWPAVWMMGNLGRAGYGASLEGMWPYSYDSCDWGTLPNQTFPGAQPPSNTIVYLPGQRLSACTCTNINDGSHPGPKTKGRYVGRSAPELDVFEAQVDKIGGGASQSLQMAPFDDDYFWGNTSSDINIYDASITTVNSYKGSPYQEALSAVTLNDQNAYQTTGGYAIYGVEYKTGAKGYVTWINNGKPAWSAYPSAIGPNSITNISQRLIPEEPLYIIINLGISRNFAKIQLDQLVFPAQMKVDYVRVYQAPGNRRVGCDPDDHPTAAYINKYSEAYSNPNLTVFATTGTGGSYNQSFPKNKLVDEC